MTQMMAKNVMFIIVFDGQAVLLVKKCTH